MFEQFFLQSFFFFRKICINYMIECVGSFFCNLFPSSEFLIKSHSSRVFKKINKFQNT